MKKLMTLLASVAVAAGVQAAALNWTTWGYINDGGSDSDWITGGMAYLVQVTDAASFSVSDSLAITGGAIVDHAAFDVGTAAGVLNDTSDLVNGSKYLFAIIATTDGAGSAVPTTGFYGVDANGGTGTSFYEVTWNVDVGAAFAPSDDFGGVSMSTAVVPEPTSSLLMLVGLAGLALRRRRA